MQAFSTIIQLERSIHRGVSDPQISKKIKRIKKPTFFLNDVFLYIDANTTNSETILAKIQVEFFELSAEAHKIPFYRFVFFIETPQGKSLHHYFTARPYSVKP